MDSEHLQRFVRWCSCDEAAATANGKPLQEHARAALTFAHGCGWRPPTPEHNRILCAIDRLEHGDPETVRRRSLVLAGWCGFAGFLIGGWFLGHTFGPSGERLSTALWFGAALVLATVIAVETYLPARRLLIAATQRSVMAAHALLLAQLPGYSPPIGPGVFPAPGRHAREPAPPGPRSRTSWIADALLSGAALAVCGLALLGEVIVLLLAAITVAGWRECRTALRGRPGALIQNS